MKSKAKLFVSLFGAAVSACSTGQLRDVRVGAPSAADAPPQALVSRIEAALQQAACVGSLDQWARFYRWSTRPRDFVGPSLPPAADSRDEVAVTLREAGKFGYRPGSFIEPSPPPLGANEIWMELDDRSYRVGFATYTVATDTLKLRSCGPNINGSPPVK